MTIPIPQAIQAACKAHGVKHDLSRALNTTRSTDTFSILLADHDGLLFSIDLCCVNGAWQVMSDWTGPYPSRRYFLRHTASSAAYTGFCSQKGH